MRLKRLIKRFDFHETVRSKIELGTDVRLDPDNHVVKLVGDGVYPTTADLYVKTWIANPDSVKQWIGFECVVTNPKDDLGQELTGVNFRLSDGTDEYWWNGAAWVVNTSDWNTEGDIANNIGTFPATSKKIAVVVNLYTTDETVTPSLETVKILYSSDVKHYEDYVYRTIVRQLREQVRPISDYPIVLAATTSSIDLNVYKLETPYNVVGIDAVFDHTNDPQHAVDLFQSFDVNTQIITLSSAIAANDIAWIQIIWEPEVAVTTSQEFTEVAKVPSIILSDVNLINSAEIGQDDWVSNKSDHTSVKVLGPKKSDIDVVLRTITDSARDQSRLVDELNRFFRKNTSLVSLGMDEEFRLWLLDEHNGQTEPNNVDIHSGRLRFLLVGALFYEREAVNTFTVERFRLTGDMDVEIN